MARHSRLTSLMLLAVLCASPAAASFCAAACALGSSAPGAHGGAAPDDGCHGASSPADTRLTSLPGHDCHDHGGETGNVTAVAPGRTDTSAVISRAGEQAGTHAGVPLPAAPAGALRTPDDAPLRTRPPVPLLALRI